MALNSAVNPESGVSVPGRCFTPTQIKTYLLLVILLVHTLFTFFGVTHGYLLIDEVNYHRMMRDFSAGFGLETWNGYTELPSEELTHEAIQPHFGRLVVMYPHIFAFVAYPFYLIAGFFGLFVLNSLCFVGVVACVYFIARRLFHDEDLALNACFVLIFAGFAWEYSQAAWPHATALFFSMAGFSLFTAAYTTEPGRRSYMYAGAGGLIAGLACGIRVDSVLLLPALTLPFLFARPWRPLDALCAGLGILPPLIACAFLNLHKFGKFHPFSYGTTGDAGGSLFLIPIAAAGIVGLWALSRPRFSGFTAGRTFQLIGIGVALCVLGILVTGKFGYVADVIESAYVSTVDIRILDPSIPRPAMGRTPDGGVVYAGGLKKALLQSMPYLPILLIPVVRLFKAGKDFSALAVVFLCPALVIGYHWHAFYAEKVYEGGLCLNYRYFYAALPFLAILTAYGLREFFRDREPLSPWMWPIIACASAAAFFVMVRSGEPGNRPIEFALLSFPLWLSVGVLVFVAAERFKGPALTRGVFVAGQVCIGVALVWSATVALFYDYQFHSRLRQTNYDYGGRAARAIRADSIFFAADYLDAFMRVQEVPGVRIALPMLDDFKDFPELVRFHLTAGRRAYAVFSPGRWKMLQDTVLSKYTVTPLAQFPNCVLAEISSSGKPSRAAPAEEQPK